GAVGAVQGGAEASGCLPQCCGEGDVPGFDDGDVQAQGSRAGGNLGTDEASADDHDAAGTGQGFPQRPGVSDRAQQVHSGEVGGPAGGAGPHPGGDDERVVGDGVASRVDGPGPGVERV